jgi:hypothetical protein
MCILFVSYAPIKECNLDLLDLAFIILNLVSVVSPMLEVYMSKPYEGF